MIRAEVNMNGLEIFGVVVFIVMVAFAIWMIWEFKHAPLKEGW
jgi:Mn2+/Fe2+ NRAMP family transporter